MENHSWEHAFGLLKRRENDGFPLDDCGKPMTLMPQHYANGSTQLLCEMPITCAGATNGPSQNWQTSDQQYNNGSMNGWGHRW
ncbi:hypothetical protein N7486_005924 [Penicillium sp. IBT 16267x]|nr:hypothetical protein N7486_005924 [Penicillium sp. IBT 16267x]